MFPSEENVEHMYPVGGVGRLKFQVVKFPSIGMQYGSPRVAPLGGPMKNAPAGLLRAARLMEWVSIFQSLKSIRIHAALRGICCARFTRTFGTFGVGSAGAAVRVQSRYSSRTGCNGTRTRFTHATHRSMRSCATRPSGALQAAQVP